MGQEEDVEGGDLASAMQAGFPGVGWGSGCCSRGWWKPSTACWHLEGCQLRYAPLLVAAQARQRLIHACVEVCPISGPTAKGARCVSWTKRVPGYNPSPLVARSVGHASYPGVIWSVMVWEQCVDVWYLMLYILMLCLAPRTGIQVFLHVLCLV